MAANVIQAHGAMSSGMDMLVSLGPVLLGCTLIFAFVLLLAGDKRARAKRRSSGGYRDERPTSARLLFSGAYYELDKLAQWDYDTDSRYQADRKTSTAG